MVFLVKVRSAERGGVRGEGGCPFTIFSFELVARSIIDINHMLCPVCLSDVVTDDVVMALGVRGNEELVKTWPSGTICLRTSNVPRRY